MSLSEKALDTEHHRTSCLQNTADYKLGAMSVKCCAIIWWNNKQEFTCTEWLLEAGHYTFEVFGTEQILEC